MIFGQYFPNSALFGTDAAARALVSPLQAALVEGFGTGVLVLVIFALTARRNSAAPGAALAPIFIGLTIAALISLFAPITQASWNPARDLGPRLVSLALGWGSVAIPGPEGGFWVHIVGPLMGGLLGGLLWQLIDREDATPPKPTSTRESTSTAFTSAPGRRADGARARRPNR